MEKAFLSGSIKIKNLHAGFKQRVRVAAEEGCEFLVGDASGSDTAIQELLLECRARDVIVYCSGSQPRNNLGKWPVNRVLTSAPEGTRSFFTAKDLQMADDATCGIMIWDAASAGTLSNVFELTHRGKKSEVFINKHKAFTLIEGASDVEALIGVMSPAAYQRADRKIGIRRKMDILSPVQVGFDF